MPARLLEILAGIVVPALDVIAVAAIVAGTLATLVRFTRTALSGGKADDVRGVWTGYARWLVAALTFQVAADIVATTVAPSWHDIGRLAAIAGIRTFLDVYLERDLREASSTYRGPNTELSAVARSSR